MTVNIINGVVAKSGSCPQCQKLQARTLFCFCSTEKMSSSLCLVHLTFLSSFSTHSYDEETGSMDSGYPRSIEKDFPGIGDEIDAATYQYGTEPYISVAPCCEIVLFSSLTSFFPLGFCQVTCISSVRTCSTSTATPTGRSLAS